MGGEFRAEAPKKHMDSNPSCRDGSSGPRTQSTIRGGKWPERGQNEDYFSPQFPNTSLEPSSLPFPWETGPWEAILKELQVLRACLSHSPVLPRCLPPQIVVHVTDLLLPLTHQGRPLAFQAQEVASLIVLHIQEEAVGLQEKL